VPYDLSPKELQALRFIRNALAHNAKAPSVRDLMRELGYRSPHSAMLVLNRLIEEGILRRNTARELEIQNDPERSRTNPGTIEIPLVGNVACGRPLLARENVEMTIPVSTTLARPPYRYFLLRAVGDSMNNKGIGPGDLVLVRQQPDADNGQVVVALIDDEATVKELHRSEDVILLKPKSSNPAHRTIVMADDFQIQGVVVATIPRLE
jgi:repressor LexA